MNAIPESICCFLEANHVLSLAVCAPWPAAGPAPQSQPHARRHAQGDDEAAAHQAGAGLPQTPGIWAASCFYVFDAARARLIVLSSRSTLHGRMMLDNPQVSGTIAGQPAQVQDIRGVQFLALARCLTDDAEKAEALALYTARHPVARGMPADVWSLSLHQLKFTDNQVAFGHKTYWQRDEGVPGVPAA